MGCNLHSPENPNNKSKKHSILNMRRKLSQPQTTDCRANLPNTEKSVPMKAKGGQALTLALVDTAQDKGVLKSQYHSLENSTK